MTVGLACWAMVSGSAPKSAPFPAWAVAAAAGDPPPGGAPGTVAPMTTSSAVSASRRIALPTFEPSRAAVAAARRACWRTNACSARSVWARTISPTPGGTTCRTSTSASNRAGRARRRTGAPAQRAGRRGRGQDPPDLPDAALLDHRDVARRVAHDLVDRGREDRLSPPRAGRAGVPAPPEDDQVRLLLGGQLDDALGRPPPDPHDRAQLDALGHEI